MNAAKERKKSVKIGSQNDREIEGQRRTDITEQHTKCQPFINIGVVKLFVFFLGFVF